MDSRGRGGRMPCTRLQSSEKSSSANDKSIVVFGEKKGTNDDSNITMIRMVMRMRMIRKPEFSAMCLGRRPPELSSRRE